LLEFEEDRWSVKEGVDEEEEKGLAMKLPNEVITEFPDLEDFSDRVSEFPAYRGGEESS